MGPVSKAWYQDTETRVDFSSSLQLAGNGLVMASAGGNALQYWQTIPASKGYNQVRNKVAGSNVTRNLQCTPRDRSQQHTTVYVVELWG
jgi:hypothetical protein